MLAEAGTSEPSGKEILIVIEDQTEAKPTGNKLLNGLGPRPRNLHAESGSFEASCVILAENEIEAQRISNNYKFGFKKWKSHVTSRPLATRSEIVQDLYSDISKIKRVKVTTLQPFNIIYTLMFGWWLAAIYLVVGAIMYFTVIGRDYGSFCFRMAQYFLWPFGKFVHQVHQIPLHEVAQTYTGLLAKENRLKENTPLLPGCENSTLSASFSHKSPVKKVSEESSFCRTFWNQPQTYFWLVLGIPVLWPIHALIWFISWIFVISIPIAKVNFKMMVCILFMTPNEIQVQGKSTFVLNPEHGHSEIIMYTHQAVNCYYYKLTVDGINVILFNLLLFVVLSLILGYADKDDIITDAITKCILGVLAIVPLTYYVGMAITSISAQSSFAVGAILNATFGSMVEVILFIIMLKKGNDSQQECYQELVKSSLTGAILVSILFIPGISMVVGGIKFRTQNFNPKSASVSSALLFVSIAGMFSPTIFSMLYGDLECRECERVSVLLPVDPPSESENQTVLHSGFHCKSCTQSVFGVGGDRTVYDSKVKPLVFSCCVILPIAYVVGLVFTMKTHSSEVYDEFETQLKNSNIKTSEHSEGLPQWSRLKSVMILVLCAIAIALCGDLISNNIQPLLEKSGMSEYFIGVTMLSLVAELPEVVNGIQFALQNNVNLGIEIGSSTAIQVCLVQIPMLVLVELIYPMGFHLIFAEVHFWAVIFSVIVINYIFQDGKSDYFQGTIVVFIYILLMLMYAFTMPPDNAVCLNEPSSSTSGNANVSSITTPLFM